MSTQLLVRTLGAAALGALLGMAYWLESEIWPWNPILHGSLAACALVGALAGVVLALGFAAFGIDIPFFPSRRPWRRPQSAPAPASFETGTRASFDHGFGSTTHATGATEPSEVRWISPEKYERWSSALKRVQIHLGLAFVSSMLVLIGIAVRIVTAGSAGFFGNPSSANIFFYLAFVTNAILFALGGSLWRIIALAFSAGTLYIILGP